LRVLECDFGNESAPSVFVDVAIFKLTCNGRLEISKSSLSYCEFEWKGFIEINGGIFILKETIFSNIKLTYKSLITTMMNTSCGNFDILIEECKFSNIELISGNGSVIYSEINNGDKLRIISIIFSFLFFIYFIFIFIFIFILDSTFVNCNLSGNSVLVGGAIFINQEGGSFSLIDESSFGISTFSSCGISNSVHRSLGGGLYIRNYGGEAFIGGSTLSFTDCFATNGTEIFIECDNLETAIENRIFFDFDYDKTSNDFIVGTSYNNLYSLTPIYLYDCYIKNNTIKKEGNSCLLTCSLGCPPSTAKGILLERFLIYHYKIILIIYLFYFYFFF
jgi:hypothetical protein